MWILYLKITSLCMHAGSGITLKLRIKTFITKKKFKWNESKQIFNKNLSMRAQIQTNCVQVLNGNVACTFSPCISTIKYILYFIAVSFIFPESDIAWHSVISMRPEAEFMNVQSRWGSWAWALNSQTWGFYMDFLNHRGESMIFYQVFFLSPLQNM
jgi:hypothetical protein